MFFIEMAQDVRNNSTGQIISGAGFDRKFPAVIEDAFDVNAEYNTLDEARQIAQRLKDLHPVFKSSSVTYENTFRVVEIKYYTV